MSDPADFTAILAHWEATQPDAVAITFAGVEPDLGRAGRARATGRRGPARGGPRAR